MANMRILIKIVFVIFITNGIDYLGRVCDDCCDCFKEEEKNKEKKEDKEKDENKEKKKNENITAESLVNENWFNAKKNLVLMIFKKEDDNDIFTSTENGDKISFKFDEKDNSKIVYQNEAENKLKLNGKKYAFFEIKTNTDKTVYLYCNDIESYEDIGGIFEETTHVSISVIACDTENVMDMEYMFFKCSSLKELDLKNFNTKNVTDMRSMFSWCINLTKLKFGVNFNTENVTNMGYMFNYCQNLTELEIVVKFNITNVLINGGMFKGCNKDIKNKILDEDK